MQQELQAAWGFNFYLPRQLLLLRFPPTFARQYVDGTCRHPTFRAIAHAKIPALLKQVGLETSEAQRILTLVKQRPAQDAYYRAWIRKGDINVMMRLRDWRPNGEVIAPLSVRHQMAEEASAASTLEIRACSQRFSAKAPTTSQWVHLKIRV